jgi:hypothetical protein
MNKYQIFFIIFVPMDDITLFIKLVKREYPELRFGSGFANSPKTVVVFSKNKEVGKYCRQVRSFLGGTSVIHLLFLPERPYVEPKPKMIASFSDKIFHFFSYFDFFKLFKTKTPQN